MLPRSGLLSVPLLLWAALSAQAHHTLEVGIFGSVQSVSPLVVADQTIAVPEGLPVLSALGAGRKIAVGDTLAVTATFDETGLTARRVLEIYPIAGRVDAVSGNTASVLGSDVYIAEGRNLNIGDWVAVSGFWSGATVISSVVHSTRDARLAQLAGVFDLTDETGVIRMGGSAVVNAPVPEGDFDDGIWILNGEAEADALNVRLMTKGVFAGVMDLEVWQGYASAPVASETYMIHGTAIFGAAREADMPAPGALVRVCAQHGRVITEVPDPTLQDAFAQLECNR